MNNVDTKAFAYHSVPTRWDRLCRAAGFRFHLGDEPEGMSDLPGWTRTDISLDFSWPDRLRLLFTGKLRLSSIVASETPDVGITKSRIDWRIVAPGKRDD